MLVKRLLFFLISFTLCFTSIDTYAQHFDNEDEQNFWSRTTFRLTTNYFIQNKPLYNSNRSDDRIELLGDIFYDNPVFGIEGDYYLSDKFALSTGLTLSRSTAETDFSLSYIIPPPPGTLSNFNHNYSFFSTGFEPKAKFLLGPEKIKLFWSAGPIFSLGFLSIDVDASPFDDPENFRGFTADSHTSPGIGFNATTGIQYFTHRNFGFSLDLGYRYLTYKQFELDVFADRSTENQTYSYNLSTFQMNVGVIFRINTR